MTHDPKQAWQASAAAPAPPALAEVRARAQAFYRRIRRQSRIAYAACAVAALASARNAVLLPHPLQKIGAAWLVAAVCFIAWQLHRRGSALAPDKAAGMDLCTFARAQLVRQRDARRAIFWFYILPLLPGIALSWIGNGQDPALASRVPIWQRWAAIVLVIAAFAAAWYGNRLSARKLQRQIDELDALAGEG